MTLKTIEKYLKMLIVGFALCGLLVYAYALPSFGQDLAYEYPEFAHWYIPWLVFLWITVIPCYLVLVYAWKVATNIGDDRTFSYENGICFKKIGFLAGGDTIFFVAGNIIFFLMNMNHPSIMILSLVPAFFGIAIWLGCKMMAQLVDNAANLQEETNWTI